MEAAEIESLFQKLMLTKKEQLSVNIDDMSAYTY